jgi:hypothetical protein
VTRTSISGDAPQRRAFGVGETGWWPNTVASWMVMAFLIAVALAAIVLAIFGVGGRGTGLALRVTARWSFLLFWLAYAGGAMVQLWELRLGVLARHGRELGLAFASAQLVHVGLIFWLIHIATEPVGAMVFFWIGILCTYLLALFSLPWFRDALGPRLWRVFRTLALEYIAVAFAADFIVEPLMAGGPSRYPLTYLPFALMLVCGAGLRVAAFSDRESRHRRENVSSSAHGWSRVYRFSEVIERVPQADRNLEEGHREASKERLIVWPLEIFVGIIWIALALGHGLGMFFWAALGLYGPLIVVFATYFLFKFAIRRVKFIGSQFK